jgi:hypothetical protein
VQGLQASQVVLGWSLWGLEHDQTHAFKTLEDPAQCGAIGRLFELVGDGLASGGELLAHPVLGQPIDQQTEHHHQAERHNAGRLLHED